MDPESRDSVTAVSSTWSSGSSFATRLVLQGSCRDGIERVRSSSLKIPEAAPARRPPSTPRKMARESAAHVQPLQDFPFPSDVIQMICALASSLVFKPADRVS